MKATYSTKPDILIRADENIPDVWLYRYDIKQVGSEWEAEEVVFYGTPTSNRITEQVIAAKWEQTYEQKLVNEYNAAKLGLYDEDTAAAKVAKYTDFLTERNRIKSIIDGDCAKLGIE